MNPDVAIVGAGIVGAACAAACTRRGLRVLLLDRQPPGGGATAAGMGHLVVMDDSEAQFALTGYSRRLWWEMRDALPAEVEFRDFGTLWVAADAEEMDEVRRKHSFYAARGIATEVLDAHALAEAEPCLRSGLAGALCVPEDAVVYPPCAARWLAEQARERGAAVRCDATVTSAAAGGLDLATGERIAAGKVVIATGAWAPELVPGLQVAPRKGHLVITERYPGWLHHQLVELGYLKSAHSTDGDSVAFNLQPRATGQILIGSSRQYGARDGELDGVIEPAMLARMLRRAGEYVPGLERLSAIRTWTGFRAATPDKLPLIGPVAAESGLWLATGHEGLGITTALGTAELLADMLTGAPTAIPAAPYLPARFATAEVGSHA